LFSNNGNGGNNSENNRVKTPDLLTYCWNFPACCVICSVTVCLFICTLKCFTGADYRALNDRVSHMTFNWKLCGTRHACLEAVGNTTTICSEYSLLCGQNSNTWRYNLSQLDWRHHFIVFLPLLFIFNCALHFLNYPVFLSFLLFFLVIPYFFNPPFPVFLLYVCISFSLFFFAFLFFNFSSCIC